MHLKHKAAALAAAFALAASGGARAVQVTPPASTVRLPHSAHSPRQGMIASPDCDPFSDWDDGYGNGGDDSTTHLLPQLAQWSPRERAARTARAGAVARGNSAAQVIGTTPEEIHRRFLRVVTANLANAGTASRIARLSDKELAAIGSHAALGSAADRAALLKLFATRLDAKALVRVSRAFGRAPVTAAVHAYADRETRAAFDNDVEGYAAPPPEGGGGGGGGGSSGGGGSYPRPNLNMTLEEIYLDFRTAPVGSLSPSAALAETSAYAGAWLYLSWNTGQWVGDQIYGLISTYAPGLDDTLGGTIASMIENMWAASSDIQEGRYEAAIDELLGFPVTDSSDPSGDWDVTDTMVEYYMWNGICGY